jgi:hypothetical protein
MYNKLEGTRPSVIPKVQLDLWGEQSAGKKQHSVHDLARSLLQEHQSLVCLALLKVNHANTICKIAKCIQLARQPILPQVSNGQVYLHESWRIRWQDMSVPLHNMVLNLKAYSQLELQEAFRACYDPDLVVSGIFRIIGPARAAGARAVLLLGTALTGE